MVFSYLDENNIFDRYEASKKYTEKLTQPFPEFERIARNRPFDGIDPAYPKTTDGTTASIVRKTPRRVVQQLPTGVVESDDDEDWLPIVAQFIYTNKILPYANEEYDLIQKSWLAIESGLSFGSAVSYAPFINHDGYFCPDMTLPYWGDVMIQKGKKSGYACSYVFIRAWWQKADIEALIDSENKLAAKAKERGEKYEATWDTEALKKVMDNEDSKDIQGQTPSEKEKGLDTEGVELVTGFQKGVGAKFLTFNPETKQVVRTKVSKDPRGKMPIDWMYGDIDGSNPLGRGIIELIGGLQNLIDSDMQMYQFNRALALAPPVIKYGNVGKFRFVPNTVVKAQNPATDKIEAITIDTSAITNYPQLYGLQKSQLLNLVNSPDTSVSAEVGNPGFGKTPEALSQQKAVISVDDNYVRKMFETWFGNWSETAINLYFAERAGVEELQLDDETASKLRKLPEFNPGDPEQGIAPGELAGTLSDDNKIIINYDTATPALKFRVDASTSKMKDDSDQLAALQGVLQVYDTTPSLQQIIPAEKIVGIWNSLVSNSGVEDPEDLTIDIEEFKQQQQAAAEAQMQAQTMQAQAAQTQVAQPAQEVVPTPAEQPVDESTLSPLDQQLISTLRALGVPEPTVQQAMQMAEQGATSEDILQAIGVSNG